MSGALGSNACPAGSVRIEAEATCRTAAIAAGKTAGSPFGVTDPYVPRGCYYASASTSVYNNYAYFNPHPVGAGESGWRLLCAVTSGTPPPPSPPARAAALSMRTCAIVHALRRCGGAAGYSRGTGYCTGSWVVYQSVMRFCAIAVRTCCAASGSVGLCGVPHRAVLCRTQPVLTGYSVALVGSAQDAVGSPRQCRKHLIVLRTVRHCRILTG